MKAYRRFIHMSETCKIILLKKIIFYITRNKPDFCKVNLNKVYVLKVFSIAIYVIDHQSLHRLQSYFRVFTQSACHIFFYDVYVNLSVLSTHKPFKLICFHIISRFFRRKGTSQYATLLVNFVFYNSNAISSNIVRSTECVLSRVQIEGNFIDLCKCERYQLIGKIIFINKKKFT